MKTSRPQGFTLVELLVVITIIGMLMALLVPAVGAARARARQTQCANDMRQVALALQAFESRKGELPGRVNDVAAQAANGAAGVTTISWVAMLLNDLERGDLWDTIRDGSLSVATSPDLIPRLPMVICPADVQTSGAVPGLSFVGNSGYWDANAAPFDYPENGIFHLRTGAAASNKTTMEIQDGVATTLLFSENIQAGIPDVPTGNNNEPKSWLLSPTEVGDAFVWVNDANPSPDLQARINQGKDEPLLNSSNFTRPQFSRPSSNHPDGVNVAYCDAHVQFLREDIAYHVYQQLMTTYGRKAKIPPSGSPPNDALRVYVLNAKDYQ